MFTKENIEIKSINIENKEFYKQYNNISITPFFVIMLNNYYEQRDLSMHNDYENNIKNYLNRAHLYRIKKNYDKTIVNLYSNGKIIINNEEYLLADFYIVFEKKKKYFELMCINSKYPNKEIKYDTAVKLIDTTAFIEIINNNEVKNNTIIINDEKKLLLIIQKWDGMLHDKVSETDAIINKKMIGKD